MKWIRLFVVAFLFSGFLEAESPAKSKLVSASLFKNGLGFITWQAEVSPRESILTIPGLSEAIHGTFWIQENTLQEIVAIEEEENELMQAITLAELLEANVGQTLEFRIAENVVKGKVVSVPLRSALPYLLEQRSGVQGEPGSIVILQTESGTLAVNKNEIREIKTSGGDLKIHFERKKKKIVLRVRSGNSKSDSVRIQSLTRGITWAPSCVIDITESGKASLSAKAEIINELEDLQAVDVQFITGFPNLQFTEVFDPIAMRGNLAAFLSSLNRPRASEFSAATTNIITQQSPSLAGFEDPASYTIVPLTGQSQDELFFYEQKNVTLLKGQRGYYPLYTLLVPYDHVYEWKIPDTVNEGEEYRQRQDKKKEEIVWHSLRLTNTGSVPWTTAPAMVTQNGKLLGQDLVYYTSPGTKTVVRITQALDIKAEQAEYEVERTRGALQIYGSNYDLVAIRGVLKVHNYKNQDVTLTVEKELSGEGIQSTPPARVNQIAKGLKSVNARNILQWELPVKSGEKMEIEYHYKMYIVR